MFYHFKNRAGKSKDYDEALPAYLFIPTLSVVPNAFNILLSNSIKVIIVRDDYIFFNDLFNVCYIIAMFYNGCYGNCGACRLQQMAFYKSQMLNKDRGKIKRLKLVKTEYMRNETAVVKLIVYYVSFCFFYFFRTVNIYKKQYLCNIYTNFYTKIYNDNFFLLI